MKIGPVAAQLFRAAGHTDRQTDMTKPIDAFRQVRKRAWKIFLSKFVLAILRPYTAHLRRECHNSKCGIFELLV